MKQIYPIALALALSGCALFQAETPADMAPPDGMLHPQPRPGGGALPSSDARTVDAFDTTSAEERAAAVAAAPAAEQKLGGSIATLGNPADPGFWLETPLVSAIGQGRVVSDESGKSVAVELRPIDGPASGGSRISLSALRLLEIGLTGLHPVTIYAGQGG